MPNPADCWFMQANQISTDSEINTLTGTGLFHWATNPCVLLLEPGSRALGPLMRASIGITDEASCGTISSTQPQRNPTYRPSS